jgi:hypothetical protein
MGKRYLKLIHEEENSWSNDLGEIHFFPFNYDDDYHTAEAQLARSNHCVKGIIASNADAIFKKIIAIITSHNTPDGLGKLLRRNFIYPWNSYHQTDIYATRPIIEVLFFEYPAYFIRMMDEIKKSENIEFYKILEEVITDEDITDLSQDILYTWTKDMRDNAAASIQDLEHYCDRRKPNINTMTSTLTDLIKNQPIDNEIKQDDYTNKHDLIIFKAKIIQTVIQHQPDINYHRGCGKRFFSNFMGAIFLFIPQIIHYAFSANHDFWFCNRTTSQEKTDTLLQHMHLKNTPT